jgi:hypothetical protein
MHHRFSFDLISGILLRSIRYDFALSAQEDLFGRFCYLGAYLAPMPLVHHTIAFSLVSPDKRDLQNSGRITCLENTRNCLFLKTVPHNSVQRYEIKLKLEKKCEYFKENARQ